VTFFRGSQHVTWLSDSPKRSGIELSLTGTAAKVSKLLGLPVLRTSYFHHAFPEDAAPDPLSWISIPLVKRWSQKYDVIVCYEPFVGLSGVAAWRFNRLPFVVFAMESTVPHEPSTLRKFTWPLTNIVLRQALLRCGTTERVVHESEEATGLGFELVPYGCSPIERINEEKKPFVLVDTRWSATRNPFFVLEIAKHLKCADLVMTGLFASQELESSFRAAVSDSGLQRVVKILPVLTASQLAPYYESAIAYMRWPAVTSDGYVESGPSMGVYMALESGCPLILSRELSNSSVIEHAGAAVTVGMSAAEFAQDADALVMNPGRVRQMARSAWALAKKWDWAASSRLLVELIEAKLGSQW
jgi:glycosyltransferase involved in cell wall biosynthesis